ncbi:YggT family protein [methanotrophic endosymbiont of Bathymodiolus puteoserpentis (Logatchev)]|jgi:YggT family protein|uniref:YggT family protein n=1 Tax=methanotrophic endosymbiont of Bathymodiolus puteoserpentis (Logatchev) TaxID=343235 RepID=UPI0013C89722|nr:YggT family protein [methanotrophic endosymbiont of Bathymodiolus puteoserpentis (Logatchev)]SHE20837.1 Integral membrane protein YggT, involved in response to extracytoplasmic stress (osmotic shock) [methanotrophic endosymbiont of Bathymodiolus puteoserpentis (Logatchev)]
MSSNYLSDPIIFLLDTVFSFYILAVLIRFLLQWVGGDFYNPISQFLVKITHPILRVLRRYIPAIGKIDTSSVVLLLVLQMISDSIVLTLKGLSFSFAALALLSFSQLISLLINVFVFAIFARAILSWLNPGTFNAASNLLYSLTEPLLATCRRIVPDLGGIDLSPLIVLVGLQLAKMLIIPPLQQLISLVG